MTPPSVSRAGANLPALQVAETKDSGAADRAAGLVNLPSYLGTGTRLLLLAVLVLELGHHRRVGQSSRVAQRFPLRDVAEQPPHDLAAARLRQISREDEVVRARQRADLLSHVPLQLLHQVLGTLSAVLDGDEGGDGL